MQGSGEFERPRKWNQTKMKYPGPRRECSGALCRACGGRERQTMCSCAAGSLCQFGITVSSSAGILMSQPASPPAAFAHCLSCESWFQHAGDTFSSHCVVPCFHIAKCKFTYTCMSHVFSRFMFQRLHVLRRPRHACIGIH